MNKLIEVYNDKKYGCIHYVIPMKDESHSNMFEELSTALTWVYYNDGRPHMNRRINRNIPVIVGPKIIDIWGGENDVRAAGYRKHWLVFFDVDTNAYYFGNYPQFIKSDNMHDRETAKNMMCIDIELLMSL